MYNTVLNQEVLDYLKTIIVGAPNEKLIDRIKYETPSSNNIEKGYIYIVPSRFFDEDIYMSAESIPRQSKEIFGTAPVLFGTGNVEKLNNSYIVYADLIASIFFLITRYEECVNRDCRDVHGRYIGKESVPYKMGFLQVPIVEIYAEKIQDMLSELGYYVKKPFNQLGKIYVTHDIDNPWMRAGGNFIERAKMILKDVTAIVINKDRTAHKKQLFATLNWCKDDIDTFDWLIEKDSHAKEVLRNKYDTIYFLMTCSKGKYDNGYIHEYMRTKELVQKLQKSGAIIGLHVSYQAGEKPEKIQAEVTKFREMMKSTPRFSRHHYLMCREPEDMRALIREGITDDFSCCYADGGGFRLGTCHPVRWIDPIEMCLTNLVLHPLVVTESKLCDPQFMNMSYNEARQYVFDKIELIKKYNGEFVVLFHNTSVAENNKYHLRELYEEMMEYLERCNDENCGL